MKARSILILFVFIISGCSAKGPLFQSVQSLPSNKSVVYVYRPSMMFNATGWPDLYINEEKIASLKNGGYVELILDPGSYMIKAKGSVIFTNWYPSAVEGEFTIEAGKEYYIRVTPQLTGAYVTGEVVSMSGSASMVLVPSGDARKEILKTRKVN